MDVGSGTLCRVNKMAKEALSSAWGDRSSRGTAPDAVGCYASAPLAGSGDLPSPAWSDISRITGENVFRFRPVSVN